MKYLSRLIESKKNIIEFDMSKSFHENRYNNFQSNIEVSPISPVESSWEEIRHNKGVYLEKTYSFPNKKHLKYFLSECIEESEKLSYYPELFIKENKVRVYLKNEFVDQISNEDLSFSKFLDEIYEDIFYLER